MCTKCREIKDSWIGKIMYGSDIIEDFKKKFDIVYGKGQYNKAFTNGKTNNWAGKCRKCSTAFILKGGE